MPKTINTPREELICGKIDALENAILGFSESVEVVKCVNLLKSIRHDAERMEQKLIIRKQEFEAFLGKE